MNSTKISEKWYIVGFGNLHVKLNYTDNNFIKAICESPTPPFKMKIRLVYTKGMCVNLSAMGRRNNFYMFLSFTVNSENKLIKFCNVLRL